MNQKLPEVDIKAEKLKGNSVALYSRLLRDYVLKYKLKLLAAIFFMIIGAMTTAATAFLMKPIVDEVFFEKNPEVVLYTTIAVVFIFTLRGLATFGQAYFMQWVGNKVIADIQRSLFRKLIGADLAWFHENSTGQLISRFVYDTELLRRGSNQALVAFTKDTLTAIFLVGSLFYYDWKMASIIFIALPPGAIAIRQVGKLARKASRRVLEQTGSFSTFLEEAFQGIRVIKAYGREKQTTIKGDEEIQYRFKSQFKAMRIQATSNPIVETISGVMIAAVIYYGASRVTEGATTPGTFFAFITAVMLAYQPIKSIAKIAPQIQNSLAAAQRVFDLLDIVDKVTEKVGATPLELHKGEISFNNVAFAYAENSPVLKQISLKVGAGQRVALVGPSGGGKSTILNLMPRFYDVSQGSICVDGQDVRDVTLKSLREKFALVSQDIFLFDDTIHANISYGRETATEEDVIAAAKSAAIHDFIVSLPEGYQTRVGSDGVRLSGGQKQRIAIARAMLKDAPILLLDEATSALDAEAERKVQIALGHLMTGRTSVVIAHRLTTILDADLIYVVVAGEIAEFGTHSELLAKNGVYADLYNNQFSNDTNVTPIKGAKHKG